MPKSSRAAALAGILGAVALLGTGVAQAQADVVTPECTRDAKGFHCTVEIERTYTMKDDTKVTQSWSCKSEGRASHKNGKVEQKTVIDCTNRISS